MIGALIGDIVGSRFEFHNIKTKDFELLTDNSRITDDSVMTVAVADALINHKDIIKTLKEWGRKYLRVGYGGLFYKWIVSNNKEPYNSYGNGSAMRVSSVGWIASSEEEVKELSKKVTEVTHNHIEGLKGAEVTAMCIYYARNGKDKEFIKKYVEQYYDLNFDYQELVANYHFKETCQESVPQAIYCFLISKDFEDCLRTTISIGGDCDTTSAISCAIAEAYYGIPNNLKQAIIPYIPKEMLDVINKI
jgi:type I restriction enzyme M protein